MSCNSLLDAGVQLDCDNMVQAPEIYDSVHLVPWGGLGYKKKETWAQYNASSNVLNKIIVSNSNYISTNYFFDAVEHSVIPNVTSEQNDLGQTVYKHSITFTIFDKSASARKIIESLGNGLVIATVEDNVSGLKTAFGLEQGLALESVERQYIGSQASNFYKVTLSTPDIVALKESHVGMIYSLISST